MHRLVLALVNNLNDTHRTLNLLLSYFPANQNKGRYWIRARTLREGSANNEARPDPHPDGIVEEVKATLSYDITDHMTTSQPITCTEQEPCLILNCPYTVAPRRYHSSCISIHEVRSATGILVAPELPNKNFIHAHFNEVTDLTGLS